MIKNILAGLHNNYAHVTEKRVIEILELLPLNMVLSASKRELIEVVQNVKDLEDQLYRKYAR